MFASLITAAPLDTPYRVWEAFAMSETLMSSPWAKPLIEGAVLPPQVAAEVKAILGYTPPDFGIFAEAPWVGYALARVWAKDFSHNPGALIELAALAVAKENACRYCYGSQRAVIRFLGYRADQLDRLERDLQLTEHSERERAVLTFARLLARSNPRPMAREVEALLGTGFTQVQVAELAWCVTEACFANRVATFLAMAPLTDFEHRPDTLLGRVLRPIYARMMTTRPKPVPEAALYDGPFAPAVHALAGTWGAHHLAERLRAAFDSPLVSSRAKVLCFAVVAQALGCNPCDLEARRLLAAEGIDEAQASAAIRNLDAPWLDRAEQKIVAWARCTVHYQPLDIQERTRALAAEVGTARTLEAVGITALANSMVRVALLVHS
jgi:alkylhydroperoxidase family enzyme